ncbi:mevalonate-3-kinase [Picrophilus oshimae]|uniref:Diphosphomevalonate decarboxylase n=1 Tax=Picrophilus torridus (strain ATCC 700027 / DSM 9790 / JCM 10055 / NBRC 100828 / KAW 2/3) TaxID=1122961 RepID=A0A8G2L7H0_PICTO|nr:mevalonate-3-kinase [Picrophilus oshimae]SMD30985.1 diphosphomevalonate decarboxylase [Picrophilus oshimae DSM 9789]
MENYNVKTRAFPTIGIILLGGISDKKNRIPLHTTAGIAYTGINNDVYTETKLYVSKDEKCYIDGKEIDLNSDRSPSKVIDKFKHDILMRVNLDDENNLSIDSRNFNILSGSSDSGAAALGECIESIFEYNINIFTFENDLQRISESVGRSLYGGLTVNYANGRESLTEPLLEPEAFNNFTIIGAHFNIDRKPSNEIHENIIKHENYRERIKSAERKAKKLEELSRNANIKGIFELAESDTIEYHKMLHDVGVDIINDRMENLIEKVKEMKNNFWNSYIVTGGPNVFVITEKKDVDKAMEGLNDLCDDIRLLKVAGKPQVISKNF